jgi:DNA polymerase IV
MNPHHQFTCTTPRAFFVDMNCFFAGVEQQEQPKLRGKPVIVVPVFSDTTCAITSSYEARKFGIKTGTIVSEAKKLCPSVVIIEARHHLYVKYHNALHEILKHFFVDIHPLSIDEMSCVLNARQQKSDLGELAAAVKKKMRETLGDIITCSIGVGPNVFLAKVASDLQKPNGFTLFQDDYTPKLFQCELRDLPGIGRRMEIRLKSYGIWTVKDLWEASPRMLRSVWGGVIGERWYLMLRGNDQADYGIETTEEKKSVSQSHVFAPEFRNTVGAADITLRLTSKALKRLRTYHQVARMFGASITFRQLGNFQAKQYWYFDLSLSSSSNDTLTWLPLIARKLEELPKIPEFQPFKASIYFSDLTKEKFQQLSLFEDQTKNKNLSHALDKINEKHGYIVDSARVFKLKKQAPFRISFGGMKDADIEKQEEGDE